MEKYRRNKLPLGVIGLVQSGLRVANLEDRAALHFGHRQLAEHLKFNQIENEEIGFITLVIKISPFGSLCVLGN